MEKSWSQIKLDLQSQDDATVANSLTELKGFKGDLPKSASADILPLCIEKLQHHDVVIRSSALEAVVQQLQAANRALLPHVDGLCKAIQSPNMLDLKAGSKDHAGAHAALHKNLCCAIAELQKNYAKKFMPYFKPVGVYLVECLTQDSPAVRMAGCEYWAKMQVPPVPQKQMDLWVPVVLTKLQKLIPALLQCMIYHSEHVQFLEAASSHANGSNAVALPENIETLSNTRNYAALAFENLCQIFQTEIVAIFKPILEKWMKSSNWLELEAVILALGAFTEAMGTPKEMKDVYPSLLPKLLECYSHSRPLVRSITCFAMQHFINFSMKNIKDPFAKMVKCTTALLTDSSPEVQTMAVRCMANLLAYSSRDLSPYVDKIIDGLVRANPSIKGEARYTYYECIGHVFGRQGSLLEDADIKRLMLPLMDHWQALETSTLDEKSKEEIVVVCQPLCVIAIFAKDAMVAYNDAVFQKACGSIDRFLKNVSSYRDVDAQILTGHLVAYIDLLSAVFEGQGQDIGPLAQKYKLAETLLNLVQNSDFQDKVHQSALALIGHISRFCFDQLQPNMGDLLAVLEGKLNSQTDGVRNNALWALAYVAQECTEKNDRLLVLAGKMVEIVRGNQGDLGLVINAAFALTNLGMKWPQHLGPLISKPDVFLPLCILLQQPFPRDMEKVIIFSNLCVTLPRFTRKVGCDNWAQFCIAAATQECQDDGLNQRLKTFLRDLRGDLGNKGWNKLSQQVGPQLSVTLRKKYKLY